MPRRLVIDGVNIRQARREGRERADLHIFSKTGVPFGELKVGQLFTLFPDHWNNVYWEKAGLRVARISTYEDRVDFQQFFFESFTVYPLAPPVEEPRRKLTRAPGAPKT